MSSQFLKLAVLIIAAGLAACALLAMRQSRLQAAHELARVQLRLRQSDERLLELRARVAAMVTPSEVHDLCAELGELRPIVSTPPPDSPRPTTAPARSPQQRRRPSGDEDRLAIEQGLLP